MLSRICMECNLVSIWPIFPFTLNFSIPFFIGLLTSYSRCPTFLRILHAPHFRVMADSHGSPTTRSWVNMECHVLPNGSGHSENVAISWDRVSFLWVMSIWPAYISGRYAPVHDVTMFHQDSARTTQLRGLTSGWEMRTWPSWYFSLLNIYFSIKKYI